MKAFVLACVLLAAADGFAQTTEPSSEPPAPAPASAPTPAPAPAAPAPAAMASASPRPWGRVSFYGTSSRTTVAGAPARTFTEVASSATYQLPDQDADGLDLGVDVRHTGYSVEGRPQRVSLYEGFVGARFAGGRVRARAGHLWLNDLGALGSIAGGAVEFRQPSARASRAGRIRVGAFGGLEPRIFEYGYAPDVKKGGAYLALEGEHARRNVVGFVSVRDASVTERSVLTTTNFVPVGAKVFIYQAAEYDVAPPAGQGERGLAYLFASGRVLASDRVELQGTYSRGRSVDTRSLSEDVLNGRPLTRAAIEGLLYESAGGRVTVEVVPRVRVYGGYARDVTNRNDAATGRITLGGFAGNIAGSGFDLTASDSITSSPDHNAHAEYVSLGRQIGGAVYVYGDYSTSLSVLRFSQGNGVIVEMRPQTRRISGNATINLPASSALMMLVERTTDGEAVDLRVMAGLSFRFR